MAMPQRKWGGDSITPTRRTLGTEFRRHLFSSRGCIWDTRGSVIGLDTTWAALRVMCAIFPTQTDREAVAKGWVEKLDGLLRDACADGADHRATVCPPTMGSVTKAIQSQPQ